MGLKEFLRRAAKQKDKHIKNNTDETAEAATRREQTIAPIEENHARVDAPNPPANERTASVVIAERAEIDDASAVSIYCADSDKRIKKFYSLKKEPRAVSTERLYPNIFLLDPFSGTVVSDENIYASELIEHGEQLFVVAPDVYIDYAETKVVGLRHTVAAAASNISGIVSATVDDCRSKANGNKFAVLPDSAGDFGKKVRNCFAGMKTVWRSIVAAYYELERGKIRGGKGELTVLDLTAEAYTVSVAFDYSEKYKRIIFTRKKRDERSDLNGICYKTVVSKFVENILRTHGAFDENTVDNVALSDKIYRIVSGKSQFERLIVGGAPITINGADYEAFISKYVKSFAAKLGGITKNVIVGDHLLPLRMGELEIVDTNGLKAVLYELNTRQENKIPLWVETLPALRLDRVASNGRLGSYYLVKDGTTVENTFETKSIDCEEVLTLPRADSEIVFPLTVQGVSADKHYIAKIEFDEPITEPIKCTVTLKYEFDGEREYTFILRDKNSGKEYGLTVEEGEPKKEIRRFEMKIGDADDYVLRSIYKDFRDFADVCSQRERQLRRRDGDKERPWEYGARTISKRLFGRWLSLPYANKENKGAFNGIASVAADAAKTLSHALKSSDDGLDELFLTNALATVALFFYNVAMPSSATYMRCLKTDQKRTHVTIDDKLLCNPAVIKYPELLETIIETQSKSSERLYRALSLPMLANENFVEYTAENRLEIIEQAVDYVCSEDGLKNKFAAIDTTDVADANEFPKLLRKIRDCMEFILAVLKLRNTKYRSKKLTAVESMYDAIKNGEEAIYVKIVCGKAGDYEEYLKMQNWLPVFNGKTSSVDTSLCISRIKFDGIPSELKFMHPLAYTLMSYLGNFDNSNIIGCGLTEE